MRPYFDLRKVTKSGDVTPEQRETLNKLTDLLENDDDVTNVYSLMKPAEE